MNKPIRRIALVAMVMFAALLVQVTQIIVFQQGSLNANAQNRRVRDEQFGAQRGAIVAGKTVLATSQPTSGGQFAYVRSYSDGELYAPITGFNSYDRGSSGLERAYGPELAGTADSLFVRRLVDTITGRKPVGATVETTIDPKAQQAAAKALGNRTGGVVALDAQTGAVLAMVSHPSYDPTPLSGTDIGAAGKAYESLLADPAKPLVNRASNEIYPPGSTFKLVTAAAALESGMQPSTEIDTPSALTLPGTRTKLPNETQCGDGKQTLDRALQLSCNTSYANVGIQLGGAALRTQADKFGWGYQLSDVGGVAAQFPQNPDPAQTALSAIGQFDVASNPLHMAMVSAGIANDGKVMRPYIVSTVRAADLTPVKTTQASQLSQAMSAANAQKLQGMMVNVVERGTGTNAQISGLTVGGKTGTAQTTKDRPPYAWFTSFAENNNRKIAVAVFVESANIPRSEIGGNVVAAPIAKSVMQALM
ncbi:cell elongation-specific peptidoglycan D,D-transpeptidase [Raineyella antarctica]|uniref:Cell elongation-specific peptidoglycan D,D-transpeptidase n=1 Tax=Raineyella antarctica TaxID=1577474 RepID=A0A1G6GEU6_9ACTN|nr:penicillin-binding protein 2 [Raineyella antarctica]SDB80532.1 cell elongation-specific peptidoglycan D,D-transpeptidase [Raineyella antarctica]